MKSPDHWFQTFSGKLVDAENPTPEMVDIQELQLQLGNPAPWTRQP